LAVPRSAGVRPGHAALRLSGSRAPLSPASACALCAGPRRRVVAASPLLSFTAAPQIADEVPLDGDPVNSRGCMGWATLLHASNERLFRQLMASAFSVLDFGAHSAIFIRFPAHGISGLWGFPVHGISGSWEFRFMGSHGDFRFMGMSGSWVFRLKGFPVHGGIYGEHQPRALRPAAPVKG